MRGYVFFDVVQATVVGHESGDLLPVLDQLNSGALSDGGVGLLGFNAAASRTMVAG